LWDYTLNLTIDTSIITNITTTACDNYYWALTNTTLTNSGLYLSPTGCDTTKLQLTILPITSSTNSVTAIGFHTWAVNGITYTISGIYIDSTSLCNKDTLVLTIIPLSISNVSSINEFSCSPNPLEDILNLKFISNQVGSLELKLIDLTGRIVMSKTLRTISGLNKFDIDLIRIMNGIYTLQLVENNKLVQVRCKS
jgi:hypothetical protein